MTDATDDAVRMGELEREKGVDHRACKGAGSSIAMTGHVPAIRSYSVV